MDLLKVSQLLIAIAVATSILLQARGTGGCGYRSRFWRTAGVSRLVRP